MPDRMPNRMSEDMSDRMPEDVPVRTCINVMVGITRSKVILMLMGNMSRILEVRFVRTSSGIIFCHQERPALARFVLQREATEAVTCRRIWS